MFYVFLYWRLTQEQDICNLCPLLLALGSSISPRMTGPRVWTGRGPWSTSSANVNVNYRFPLGSWDRIGSVVNSSSCGPRRGYSYREKGEQSQSCCCSCRYLVAFCCKIHTKELGKRCVYRRSLMTTMLCGGRGSRDGWW